MSATIPTENTETVFAGFEARTLEPRTCKRCGEPITPKPIDFEQPARWAKKLYCSDLCSHRAQESRRKRAQERGPRPAVRHEDSAALAFYRHPVPKGKRVLPMTRGECKGGPRPCPLVSCKFNLYLDVEKDGSIRFNFPDREPEDMVVSCALDCCDRGGMMLEDIGLVYNVDRERARQLEEIALRKLKRSLLMKELDRD